jgi:hypothetical protein
LGMLLRYGLNSRFGWRLVSWGDLPLQMLLDGSAYFPRRRLSNDPWGKNMSKWEAIICLQFVELAMARCQSDV